MLSDDLSEVFARYPDQQIKLTMSSGDTIVVRDPGDAMISGMMLHLHFIDDPLRRTGKDWRVISITNIAMAEPYSGPPSRPRRRRK